MSQEITNAALMEQLVVIKGDVGETKGKLNSFIDAHEVRMTTVESKVRSVENRQYWWAGASAIVGVVAGWFGAGHIKV